MICSVNSILVSQLRSDLYIKHWVFDEGNNTIKCPRDFGYSSKPTVFHIGIPNYFGEARLIVDS